MSLKNIEMQIAVPRTQDAGKLQSELMERGHIFNSQANTTVQKEEEQKRKTVVHKDDVEKARWRKEGNGTSHNVRDSAENRGEVETIEVPVQHPYKGKYIDFSG